jgi:hypothetical protein
MSDTSGLTWIGELRQELLMSKMTHNFTLTRDELIELLGGKFQVLLDRPRPAYPKVPERRNSVDPDEAWETFWKEICTNPDGSINVEQVKLELADLSVLIDWAPRVYVHATGGAISKPLTYPSAICAVIDEHVSDLVDGAVKEAVREHETEALGILKELAALRRHDPNAARSWGSSTVRVHVPKELLGRLDELLGSAPKNGLARMESCCDNENRSMDGGCLNCGDPCF